VKAPRVGRLLLLQEKRVVEVLERGSIELAWLLVHK